MRFTKMHGLGNDYVCIDCFYEQVGDPAALAQAVCRRRFGAGGDGLILIMPGDSADVRMRIFNADGSEAEMCGNGLACLAKYAYDHALARVNPMKVRTQAGIKTVNLIIGGDGKVATAMTDMGEPTLSPPGIPVKLEGERAVDAALEAGGESLLMTCVSMGNPHAVFYVDDAAGVALERIGPEIEHHELFPERVNAHFVQVISPGEVTMRTWERGSGITLACGTGASAVCVAGVLTGKTHRQITAHLPGGDLHVEWRRSNNHVYMTGPAAEVFTGDWPV